MTAAAAEVQVPDLDDSEDPQDRPYYLTGPCPPWCAYGHHSREWAYDDRSCRGEDRDITLTAMSAVINKDELTGKLYGIDPRVLSAALWRHYREAEPRVYVSHGEDAGEAFQLTLDEAETFARHLLELAAVARGAQ